MNEKHPLVVAAYGRCGNLVRKTKLLPLCATDGTTYIFWEAGVGFMAGWEVMVEY